jgi:Protein of unknown function (DUF2628)
MAVYTVHQPPLKKYENAPDPDRFVFVRDGFSFWAMLFGPLWMLRHRMWLILIGYVVVVIAMHFALRSIGAPTSVSTVAGFLLALLIGIEAGTLRRFTLARRRFRNVGVIVGDNQDTAEQRFFDSWIRGEVLSPPVRAAALPPSASRRPPSSSPEVIGLFPQSEAPR